MTKQVDTQGEIEFDGAELPYNLEDVETGGGSVLLPADRYLFKVVRWEAAEAGSGKAPQMMVGLEVVETSKREQMTYLGQGFIEWLALTMNANWRVRAFLDAAFGRTVKGDKLPSESQILGRMLVAEVFQDEWEGKKRTKVQGGNFFPVTQWVSSGFKSQAPKVEPKKLNGGSVGKPAPGASAPKGKGSEQVDM